MQTKELYELYKRADYQISTDTRTVKQGDLFVALSGDTFDGNAFAEEAIKKGASYAIISNPDYQIGERYIMVPDTLKTLQELATFHRTQLDIPILAIGGSNGKTTTKELVHAVLSTKYRVHTTKGNLNNSIGVPQTLLSMPLDTQIAVIEIGANHPNEHTELMNILYPTHILVTNNGMDHLEGFGSIAGVRAANKEIYDWARVHGAHLFVNKNIPDLTEDSQYLDRTLYPTKQSSSTSSLYAGVLYGDTEFKSSLFGAYNEPNILAAIALGEYFNVPMLDIQDSILKYEPSLKRSQVIRKDGYTLILDCYNANPSSMSLALQDFTKDTQAGTRLYIVGDMLEMGDSESVLHLEILTLLQKQADTHDTVWCVGPRFSQYKDEFPFTFFNDSASAKEVFRNLDLNKRNIFLKGSRGIKLEDIIKEKVPLL